MLILALGLTAAANLRLCCEVSVDGRTLDGLYAPVELAAGRRAALLAAEEILRENAVLPRLETRYTLSLSRPPRQTARLSDALLRATEGVAANQGVYLDAERMGAVESAAQLRSRLGRFIKNQLPTWAVSGAVSGRLSFSTEYGRAGSETDYDDMVLLICGAAPVFYSDGDGYTSRS